MGKLIAAWVILILFSPAPARASDKLAKAALAYSAADFATCASYASGLEDTRLLNKDAALFIQGQCRFYAGEYQKARRCFIRLARRFPNSPHAVLSSARAADCAREMGKAGLAAGEYKQAAKKKPGPRIDPAVGLYHRALFALSRGRQVEGGRLWSRLRINHPGHPLAGSLPDNFPEPAMSFDQSLALAKSLHSARKWEAALAVLDTVPGPADRRQGYRLAYRTGRILFDMRDRYEQAAAMLLAARDHAPGDREAEEAWLYYSRALGRLDRDDQAIASHLAMAKRYPKGEHAARALFYAGWLEQNQDHCDRAIEPLLLVMERYPEDRWAKDARWTLAWCHLRQKSWKKAAAVLSPDHRHANPEVGGRALYWSGVAQASRGKKVRAQVLWKKTIQRFPLTWYSLLSRLRMGPSAPPRPKLPGPRPVLDVSSRLIDRAEELIGMGLPVFASHLLRHGESGFLKSHKERSGLLVLMDTYRKAGDFHRPWRLTFRHRLGSLRRLPSGNTRAIWEHSYPACARDLLNRFAGKDPGLVLLLQAIMRTESGFDPMALSVANARGLLQLYPPTATRVAEAMQINYSEDILFEPEYNVRMAAWFIGRLVKKFRRQWPLAASAYNGGAPAMMKWCRENGSLLLDAFVESIPWTESRRYAKRVTGALARYAWLEGAPLPELRLVLEPDFLDDGIDY